MLEKYLARERRRDDERSLEEKEIFSRKFDLHQYFSPASRNTQKFIHYDGSKGISMVHDANKMLGDPKTLVVAVDGVCPYDGTELAKESSLGVFFGPDSPFNMYDRIGKPPGDLHTKNGAELMAVDYALHIIGNSSLLNDWRAKSRERLTAIIMTDSKYVYDSLTTSIWNWRKNDFRASHGDCVANRDLIDKIDETIWDLENRNIYVRFWSVPREDNKGADKLANSALVIQPENRPLQQYGLQNLKSKPFVPLLDLIQPLVLAGKDTKDVFRAVLGPHCGGGAFWVAWNIIRLALYLVLKNDLHDQGVITKSWQPIEISMFTFGHGSDGKYIPRKFTEDAVQDLKHLKDELLYLDAETVNSLFNIMQDIKKIIGG